jgi:hypothetical protein
MKKLTAIAIASLLTSAALAGGYQEDISNKSYNKNDNKNYNKNSLRSNSSSSSRSSSNSRSNSSSSSSATGGTSSSNSSTTFDEGYYYPPSLSISPSNTTAPNQSAHSIGISTPFGGIGTSWTDPDPMSWSVTAIDLGRKLNDPELERLGVEILKQELQGMKKDTAPKNTSRSPSQSTSRGTYLGNFQ